MSSGVNCRDLVIKRKRRRTAAVDPCLGYHEHRVAHDTAPSFSITTNVNHGVHDDVDTPEECTKKTDLKETSTASSDSVQAITSPFSEEAELITVEDFLRHQTITSTRRSRKTYSRKRRRVIQSSSENEEERCDLTDSHFGANLDADNSPSLGASHSPSKTNISITGGNLEKPSRDQQSVHTSFSKRIQRAAVLSGADLDFNSPPATPFALRLAPNNTRYSPRSPVRDKRAKFVDPRIPRPLDISFANKENTPHETRPRFPLSQWCSPFKRVKDVPPSVLPRDKEAQASLPQTPRSTLTPLQLVSYEEHNQARFAKFYQKLSRNGRPVIAPLVLEPNCANCDLPDLSTTALDNDNDNPFMSLPLDGGLQTRATPTQICQAPSRDNGESDSRTAPPLPSSDDLEILVPATSPSPQARQIQAQPDRKNNEDNGALQDLKSNYASSSPAEPAPVPSAKDPDTYTKTNSLAASQPRKPLRRIGTMLEGFMETARSVLFSQSQSQLRQEYSHPQLSSNDPLPLSRSTSVKKSKIDRSLSRSGRAVVSSPARLTNASSPQHEGTCVPSRRSTMRNKRAKTSMHMPSVSVFLGRAVEQPELLNEGKPSVSLSINPQQRSACSPLQDTAHSVVPALAEERDETTFHPSFLFQNYEVPNLLDLLEGAESKSPAQIMLSPTV